MESSTDMRGTGFNFPISAKGILPHGWYTGNTDTGIAEGGKEH